MTMKRRLSLSTVLAVSLAAGMLAALSHAPSALAWAPDNLPPGWTAEQIHTVHAQSCEWSYRIWTAGRAAWSNPFCTDSPSFQTDFDGWVDAHYTAPPPPPPATTATPITVTIPTSTTVATATTPSVTVTEAAPPTGAPVDTTTSPTPPADTTIAAVTTTAPTVTETIIVTTTTAAPDLSPAVQAIADRLNDIAVQLAAVTNRVARLELAGDAAWVAYLRAVSAGEHPAAAAAVARGTYLNAVYELGAFAG
jgi:hypothetical protein